LETASPRHRSSAAYGGGQLESLWCHLRLDDAQISSQLPQASLLPTGAQQACAQQACPPPSASGLLVSGLQTSSPAAPTSQVKASGRFRRGPLVPTSQTMASEVLLA